MLTYVDFKLRDEALVKTHVRKEYLDTIAAELPILGDFVLLTSNEYEGMHQVISVNGPFASSSPQLHCTFVVTVDNA